LGSALDQLSPQRYEILHNVAFDNYAFDVQSLDDELARERTGAGGVDTSGFAFNDSQLGPELSQVRSRLLAWSPAPEHGLLSDSTSAVLGGVEMSDKKEIKEMAPENLWNTFIDGGVDLGDLSHNADESHSSYTTGRIRVGTDYRVCTDFRVGALFGYNHTEADLDNEGSQAHIDSYTPGIYATYADKDGFYANGLFTYTRNQYTTDRNIMFPGVNRIATGTPGGNQFGGDLDGGHEFHSGNWIFGPSAGLTYVNLGIDSFNETGAGAANLAINNQSTDSLRSRLGGTVRYHAKVGSVVLAPHMSAFWQHEFLDGTSNITSQFEGLPAGTFSVQTVKGDSDNALLGAGLDAELNDTVTLFIDYGAEAGGATFFGQSATGGVKVAF
jgi:outer membrane autotransporter protein